MKILTVKDKRLEKLHDTHALLYIVSGKARWLAFSDAPNFQKPLAIRRVIISGKTLSESIAIANQRLAGRPLEEILRGTKQRTVAN